jgi:DNA invertase Pin-like site-specific DNA recombinase
MKTKAFGYMRVSSKCQVAGDGFPRQEKAIRDYAAANNIEIVKIFKDGGVTGTTEDRPALADLFVDLEENGHGVKTVIIEMINRLARDLMVQEIIIKDFQKNGFDLISATEGDNLLDGDPTRDLVRQVLGAISMYEKRMLVLKLKSARDRIKSKTGKCEGRKTLAEKNPVLFAEVKRLRRKPKGKPRMPFSRIAAILNAKGFTNATGKPLAAKVLSETFKRNAER